MRQKLFMLPNTCSTVGTMNTALKGIVQLKYENGVIIYLPQCCPKTVCHFISSAEHKRRYFESK